ncbi:hypothetical protein SAMD00019534_088080 [Acytostelium subglobosum LB1]|uniref:hypothetical protein n=1 Tax=Acytostelium subglobosum LB1 TaxID=1410327 RepID=UPI000644D99B|nr:hypothetical protein SAMD00019534_088080 [Acytostelium subglobosum LB1]GAM25633.1 hypothetical protein SAMD00019534_088080 [Acytostelium subglobosum LB1]|eukprot:XP_012751619.1 hypothetical protein SAMD00019534_088080 [Acytostelium subglobosum LB1]
MIYQIDFGTDPNCTKFSKVLTCDEMNNIISIYIDNSTVVGVDSTATAQTKLDLPYLQSLVVVKRTPVQNIHPMNLMEGLPIKTIITNTYPYPGIVNIEANYDLDSLVTLDLTGSLLSGNFPVFAFGCVNITTFKIRGNLFRYNGMSIPNSGTSLMTTLTLGLNAGFNLTLENLPNLISLNVEANLTGPACLLQLNGGASTIESVTLTNLVMGQSLHAFFGRFYTNLTSIVVDRVTSTYSTNLLLVTFPPALRTYIHTQSNLDQFPTSMMGVTHLNISRNIISKTIPSNESWAGLVTLDASNNILMNGEMSKGACTITNIRMVNTTLSKFDDCFRCYYSLTKSWFNSLSLTPLTTPCPIKLDKTDFKTGKNGATVTLTGQNLGWGQTTSKGLSLVIPNQQFLYTIPPFQVTSPLSSPNTTITLHFSDDVSTTINVLYDVPYINDAIFSQNSTSVALELQGTLGTTSASGTTVTAGGYTCDYFRFDQ